MTERVALALLDELLELDAAARAARLAQIGATDPELVALLQKWLDADGRRDARVDQGPLATRLQEVRAAPRPAAGDRFGAFRLVRELGAGGMGQVWLAERADGEFAQQVALKLIHPEIAGPEAAPRFRRERQILAGLRHPNIAQLVDGGVAADGQPWLAMEWVEGTSLRAEIRRGPMPLRRVLALGAQIAEALAHAHAQGVVHRDLKPENVLVTREGYAKVLDFGIAKLLAGGDAEHTTLGATQPGLLLGTVAYMSPEQASGQNVDFRSDQFALGAVMYEMATGEAAFARDTQRATLNAVLAGDPVHLRTLDPRLPPSLAVLLGRCLAKEPEQRYAATLDLAHDLKALQSGISGSTGAAPARVRPRALPALAGGVLLGAVLAAVAAFAWLRPPPSPTLQVRAEIPIAPAEELGYGFFPQHVMALSPDGRRIAFTALQAGERRIFIRELQASVAVALPGSEGASNPVFSPDGEWLAYFANQKLKKIPLAGGSAVDVAEAPNALGGIDWDRPDRILYSPHPSTGIWQVSPAGGETTAVSMPDPAAGEAAHVWPAHIPGTDTLLYVAEMDAADSYDAGRIYAFEPGSGRRTLLVDGGSDPRVHGDTLYYVRAGTIYAVPIDRAAPALTGSPKAVLQGVMYSPAIGAAQFDVGRGVMLHVTGLHGWDRSEPVVVSRDGTVQPLGLPVNQYDRLRLDREGRRAVLQITAADDDLWVYDFQRKVLGRVTDAHENLHPSWTPDGQWLVYAHHGTPAPPPPTLYRRRADGSGEPELLLPASDGVRARLYTDVSPDGREVIYAQYTLEHNFDLWILDLQTREPRLFLRTPASDILPRYSPDGRWIAWYSSGSVTETGQVYVQSARGESRRWQITTEGGIAPVWRRDGRALFFIRSGALYEVELAAGEDLAPGAPRLLFQGDYTTRYDAFPDGERFLMMRVVKEPGIGGPIQLDLTLPAAP